MSNINSVCDVLLNDLNSSISKDELMTNCVRDRLTTLYEQNSETLDLYLNNLEKAIDYNSFSQISLILNKLNQALTVNRGNLISCLERMI